MNLSSPIELYLTFFGWSFYDMLWSLLAGIGLAIYPLALTVYTIWRGASERATDDAPAAVTSVRAMQWALYTQMTVLVLAAVPMTELQSGQLAYQKACGGGANEVGGTWSNTGTTWDNLDNAVGSGVNPRVPLIWSSVMAIASGVNYAAMENIPCFGDVAGLVKNIGTTTFSDLNVKNEYRRFTAECWEPAMKKFARAMRGGDWDTYVHDTFAAANLPPWDVRKPGSQYFLTTPGFYTPCTDRPLCGGGFRAASAVTGFPYDAARDTDYNAAEIAAGVGRPTCAEWWQGTGNGNSLRERMIDQAVLGTPIYPNTGDNPVPPNVRNQIEAVRAGGDLTAGLLNDPTVEDDVILSALVANDLKEQQDSGFMGILNQIGGFVMGLFKGAETAVTTAIGTTTFIGASLIPGVGDVIDNIAGEVGSFYATMYIAKVGAPLMQALLLMLIYALLPIYIITSGYQVESVITAAVLIGAVKFFSVVWAVAAYLENAVILVLYPNQTWTDTLNAFQSSAAIERGVLNLMLIALYVIVPAVLLWLVTLAGQGIRNIGASLDGVGDGPGKIAGGAGSKTGSVGKGLGRLAFRDRRK
ncbi:MAG TPA: hypothetical protein ENK05_09680 [Gammaproteobacteria bacterium]|nr:hypothetical protein [Gammaproteobacteria bacterium]